MNGLQGLICRLSKGGGRTKKRPRFLDRFYSMDMVFQNRKLR